MIDIHLDPELAARLEAVATKTGRDAGAYLQEAIRESIEDLEDIAAAEAVLANPGRRYTMEEVIAELGLEN